MQIPQMMTLFAQPVPTYTVVIGAAIAVLTAWATLSAPVGSRRAAFDLCLVMLAAALFLGRIEHVVLRWDYYADHLDQALDVRRGGLGWHGALIGAWAVLALYRRLRRGAGEAQADEAVQSQHVGRLAPADRVDEVFAFALPVLAAAGWVGCAAAGCAYGAEIWTLADAAPGMAAELRDVYGIIAPRWNTPLYGVVLAGGVLALIVTMQRRHRRTHGSAPTEGLGGTFLLALALFSFGMFVIGYARGDAIVMVGGLRGDQVLDAAILILAVTLVIDRGRGLG